MDEGTREKGREHEERDPGLDGCGVADFAFCESQPIPKSVMVGDHK